MTIEQYGLQWTVEPFLPQVLPSIQSVFLKQGNGVVLLGHTAVHPIWGPYITVSHVVCKNISYVLPEYQWFFASELGDMCDSKRMQLYRKMHESHSKSVFRKHDNYWRVSLNRLLNCTLDENIDIFDMLQKIIHKDSIDIKRHQNSMFMYVNEHVYEQLPTKWTINNLYEIDKDYQNMHRKRYEQLWCSIAEARAKDKPVKIIAYDTKSYMPIVYIEKIAYGVRMPVVLSHEEERVR